MLEDVAHDLFADIVLLIDQALVCIEVLESFLPYVFSSAVISITPDVRDVGMRFLLCGHAMHARPTSARRRNLRL